MEASCGILVSVNTIRIVHSDAFAIGRSTNPARGKWLAASAEHDTLRLP
jgi:hypothetical protein